MKVKIPVRELLKQIPPVIASQIRSCNDLPDFFSFDLDAAKGSDLDNYRDTSNEDRGAWLAREEKKHHGVRECMTPMQWFMFCMLSANPAGANYYKLGALLRRSNETNLPNTVSVHIRGLRMAIKKHRLPYDIKNVRGSVLGAGFFKMTKKV